MTSRVMSTVKAASRTPVFVDGCRIPFVKAGTIYKDLMAVDLARLSIKGLLDRNPAVNPSDIDHLLYGNVIQEVRTTNIAREAAMGAGVPVSVPCHTVSMVCISANQAICSGAEKIIAGKADIVVAGGVEFFSDVPIRFSRPIRERLMGAAKALKKGPMGAFSLLKGLKLKDLAPEAPAIKNYTTAEVMGHYSDRLAARFGVSRMEQDQFTLRSHQNAAKAHSEGLYDNEIVPFDGKIEENGIQGDSSMEKLSKLKPAFIKPHGTHTAANSSFLTDGASAGLFMSEQKALELGMKPRSFLRAYDFVAVDPFEQLLLGPVFAIRNVLDEMGLTLADIDVFEIHEAFAGQVLANLKALDSDKFASEFLNRSSKVGEVPQDKMNNLGGSLALGHPFGATGTRLVTTATNRLHREGGKYAIVAACADGGLGHAAIIERYDA